jgi:hypothetical protein
MKISVLLLMIFMSGCSLSTTEQSKLDQFPECTKEPYRLTQVLSRDESNCIVHKELVLRNENEHKRRYQEAENAKKIQAQEIALSNKKIANYMSSTKGVADKKTCGALILKALTGRDYINFSLQAYSRSTDNFLSCTALVNYPSLTGYQFRPLSIIYNEANDVMRSYYR